jgi:hypothetical protein
MRSAIIAAAMLIFCNRVLACEPGCTCPPGEQGPQGKPGAPGAPGIKGDTGAQGAQGIQGEAGVQGTQGERGDSGSRENQYGVGVDIMLLQTVSETVGLEVQYRRDLENDADQVYGVLKLNLPKMWRQ